MRLPENRGELVKLSIVEILDFAMNTEMQKISKDNDYKELISLIHKIQYTASINFYSKYDYDIFQNKESLITAIHKRSDMFLGYLEQLSKNDAFLSIVENVAFKSFVRKAVKFWKINTNFIDRITPDELINKLVSHWIERKNITFPPVKNVGFITNLSYFKSLDGIDIFTILSVVKIIAELKIESVITATEAKKAAAYVEKHQGELLRQQAIVMRYAKQQGMIGRNEQMARKFQSWQHINQATIPPDLLALVRKTARNTSNMEARRITAELIRANRYLAEHPPIAALTELTDFAENDFISPDTVSRYVKAVNSYPRHFLSYRGVYRRKKQS